MDPNQVVHLNVGGRHHSTTVGTLTRVQGSMLASMFSGAFAVVKDKDDRVFIDRDGRFFHLILNYLRDGDAVLPRDEDARESLRREAVYFGLDGLLAALDDADASSEPERDAVGPFSRRAARQTGLFCARLFEEKLQHECGLTMAQIEALVGEKTRMQAERFRRSGADVTRTSVEVLSTQSRLNRQGFVISPGNMEYVSSCLNAAGWSTRVLYEPTMALRINLIATAVAARCQDGDDAVLAEAEMAEAGPAAPADGAPAAAVATGDAA